MRVRGPALHGLWERQFHNTLSTVDSEANSVCRPSVRSSYSCLLSKSRNLSSRQHSGCVNFTTTAQILVGIVKKSRAFPPICGHMARKRHKIHGHNDHYAKLVTITGWGAAHVDFRLAISGWSHGGSKQFWTEILRCVLSMLTSFTILLEEELNSGRLLILA